VGRSPRTDLVTTNVFQRAMGAMSADEKTMLWVFVLLLVLWIAGEPYGVSATHTALIGLSVLLLSGVLTW
jgi:divalent anion:Na+ symporter, DASS family